MIYVRNAHGKFITRLKKEESEMIDINQIINQEIHKAYIRGKSDMAGEIIDAIGCPKTPTEYIERVSQAMDLMFKSRGLGGE